MSEEVQSNPAEALEPDRRPDGARASRGPAAPRGPWSVTFSVWKAIFLREALDRLFDVRAAWMWLLLEPALHIGYIVVIWSALRARSIGGMDLVVWIVVGMLAFFLFRRTAVQVMYAVDCNKDLFIYRQVKPFDAAIIRAVLEAFLMINISVLMVYALTLAGRDMIPSDPLLATAAAIGLWVFGFGFGLVSSVIMKLVPDLEHILKLIMMPLYLISGVIMPLASIPQPYRDWLLLNPIAHGLELVRLGFYGHYHPVPGLSMNYLFGAALLLLGFGLLLYRRFNLELVTK